MSDSERPMSNGVLKRVFQEMHQKIVDSINTSSVIDRLFSDRVIGASDLHDLDLIPHRIDKCRRLLILLHKSNNPEAFVRLRQAVKSESADAWLVAEVDLRYEAAINAAEDGLGPVLRQRIMPGGRRGGGDERICKDDDEVDGRKRCNQTAERATRLVDEREANEKKRSRTRSETDRQLERATTRLPKDRDELQQQQELAKLTRRYADDKRQILTECKAEIIRIGEDRERALRRVRQLEEENRQLRALVSAQNCSGGGDSTRKARTEEHDGLPFVADLRVSVETDQGSLSQHLDLFPESTSNSSARRREGRSLGSDLKRLSAHFEDRRKELDYTATFHRSASANSCFNPFVSTRKLFNCEDTAAPPDSADSKTTFTSNSLSVIRRQAKPQEPAVTSNADNDSALPTLRHVIGKSNSVRGVTSFGSQLFIVRWPSRQQIEVYDAETFALLRLLPVPGLSGVPYGLASCSVNRCLYVSEGSSNVVLRVDANGDGVTNWRVNGTPSGLSVNADRNVLVVIRSASATNTLLVITTRGSLLRQIQVQPDVVNISHAIQIGVDRFVVSHGLWGDAIHRVCALQAANRTSVGSATGVGAAAAARAGDGRVSASYGTGPGIFLRVPAGLAVDGESGGVLAADSGNNRVLVLNPYLTVARALPVDGGFEEPSVLWLDESRDRLYVGEWKGGRVLVFDNVSGILRNP